MFSQATSKESSETTVNVSLFPPLQSAVASVGSLSIKHAVMSSQELACGGVSIVWNFHFGNDDLLFS